MNRHLFTGALVAGALALLWVGAGFWGSHVLALIMTVIIAAVYGVGAFELHRFRQATDTLAQALAQIPPNLASLDDWLVKVPATLQNHVRLRIEGERVGLPGPALAPYLVGLLVMLGMLGTFLGMVVTLNGTVFALEGTADLAGLRSAFAAPIKGLGLAFGTSVAGVATSAMLGLMSALVRRERLQAAQRLDSQIATVLRRFSLTQQRQETFKALQLQSQAWPEVIGHMHAMMAQMERMGQQLNEQLLSQQDRFHRDIQGVYTDLARSVDQSLRTSLEQSAKLAGENLQPVIRAAMDSLALDAKQMYERVADTAQRQLETQSTRHEALMQLLTATAAEAPKAAAEFIGQLRLEGTRSAAKDNELLQERSRILETLNSLMVSIDQAGAQQRSAVDTLVASSALALNRAGNDFSEKLNAEATRLTAVSAQVTSSAVEVASLSDTLSFAVRTFGDANDKLITHLQRIESAMDKSMTRSDEQLAYYVAQAREIIDLSLMSQKEIFEELRQLSGQQGLALKGVA
ncbi:MAG: hypothetical protein RJA34_2666 [Pseudomonadota bacterium]|jgi:hypothetical protein